MKASQVLAFVAGVFALLGAMWFVFPASGVRIAGKTFRFASYEGRLRDAAEEKVDVDAVLNTLEGRFAMHDDTLAFYREFVRTHT